MLAEGVSTPGAGRLSRSRLAVKQPAVAVALSQVRSYVCVAEAQARAHRALMLKY